MTLQPKDLIGRSLPSAKFGAWIVDSISPAGDGRCRLVTADLKREQWAWTAIIMALFEEMDAESAYHP